MRVKKCFLLIFIVAMIKPDVMYVSAGVQRFLPTNFTIDNFKNGELVRYDLPLLKGTAPGSQYVTILSGTSNTKWPVNADRWRAFVPLQVGINEIILVTSQGYHYSFSLTYQPQENSKLVRIVYPIASNGDGSFDASLGESNTLNYALPRLKLAGRVLQSMTAELMYESGKPRQTFRIMTDSAGEPIVDLTRSPLTVSEIRSMNGVDLWHHYRELFRDIPNRSDIIDIAVIADSHYDVDTDTVYGQTALGGKPLALFGNSTIYSWPMDVSEIERHFTDSKVVETYLFPEYGRSKEYWAAYTTSIGAVLHEFGHCLDLSHPSNPTAGDIMQRGFDYLNRLVTTYEPGGGYIDPETAIMPRWTDDDIQILQSNQWMASGDSGGGDGGPILLPPEMKAIPDNVTSFVKEGVPTTIGRIIKVDITWPDQIWSASPELNGNLEISLDKTQGSSGESLSIYFDTSGYTEGVYSSSVTITATDGTVLGSPLTVPIKLIVAKNVYEMYLPVISY